jgi:hypothetical protein
MADENGWTAIHDHMPGKEMTLTVRGSVTLPTPGYTNVRLEPGLQGINPFILILDIHADPPSGTVADVLTEYDVEYRDQTETEYESVTIRPGDSGAIEAGASIEVQHVH